MGIENRSPYNYGEMNFCQTLVETSAGMLDSRLIPGTKKDVLKDAKAMSKLVVRGIGSGSLIEQHTALGVFDEVLSMLEVDEERRAEIQTMLSSQAVEEQQLRDILSEALAHAPVRRSQYSEFTTFRGQLGRRAHPTWQQYDSIAFMGSLERYFYGDPYDTE